MKMSFKAIAIGLIGLGFFACSKISVHQPDVASTSTLKVTPSSANIPFTTAVQFHAYLVKADGRVRDVTDEVEWAVEPGSSAVNSGTASLVVGRLTPQAAGPINVNAKFENLTASAVALITTLPTSLRLEPSSFSVAPGVPKILRALAMYDDGIERDVTASADWQVTDPSVLSLDTVNLGSLKAVASGVSEVKVSLSGLEATAVGTVSAATPISLSLSPKRGLLIKDTGTELQVIASYSDGEDYDVTVATDFVSDHIEIASVDQSESPNKIISHEAGDFKLEASFQSLQAAGQYSVIKSQPVDLEISGPASIARGLSGTYQALVSFADLSTQDVTYGVSWNVDNASIVSIADPLATPLLLNALNVGSAQLTADGGLISKTLSVSVGAAVLQSLSLSPSSASVAAGLTQQLSVTGHYSDGTTADLTTSALWSSNASSVAQVNSQGLVTSFTQGMAQITATVDGISQSASLIVVAPVLQHLAVSLSSSSVAAGLSSQATVIGTYSDSSTQNLTNVASWSSDTSTIAGVTSAGLINTLTAGTTNIRATIDGISGAASLTVLPAELTGLTVSLASSSIAKGLTTQASATGAYTDGSSQDLTSLVSWISSGSSIATVNSSGLVNGIQQGTVSITGSYSGFSQSLSLTVSAPVVSSIAVTFSATSIAKGLTGQATAVATYSDSTTVDVTSTAVWSSATTSVASINSSGVITGVAAGTSVISATFGGVVGSNSITITAPTAVSLALSFNKTYTNVYAEMLTATVTATMSDGSTVDVSYYGTSQGMSVSMTNNGCFQHYNGQSSFTAVGYQASIQCSSVVTYTLQGISSNSVTISAF